jgi:hypothetical protein
MRQIAELLAAEWVVAEILDDGAAVGIAMRLPNPVFRQRRKSLEQERPDLIFPGGNYRTLILKASRVGPR